MRCRHDLSNKMRRRPDFFSESWWVVCNIDIVYNYVHKHHSSECSFFNSCIYFIHESINLWPAYSTFNFLTACKVSRGVSWTSDWQINCGGPCAKRGISARSICISIVNRIVSGLSIRGHQAAFAYRANCFHLVSAELNGCLRPTCTTLL